MISRRRFMGQSQTPRYTKLEYIESTGTQYIDIGICPNKITNMSIVVTASCSTNTWLFGCRNSTSGNNQGRFGYYLAHLGAGQQTNPQYGNVNYINYNNAVNLTNKTIILCNSQGLYQNDIKICDFQRTNGSPTGDYSIYLLSCNTAGVPESNRISAKIYGCQVYAYSYPGGDKIMDLIPVYDNEKKVPCLYDNVYHKFYYNSGEGEFLYKPKNPVELEYLESNGRQCINSGVRLDTSSDIKTVVELEIPSFNKNGNMLFGGAMSTSYNLYTCHISQEDNKYYLNFKYGHTFDDYTARQEINLNQKYTVTISRNYFSVDSNQYENPNSTTKFEADKTDINLFSTYATGILGGYIRIYSAKIYKDNVLLRDFVPMLNTDGVLCLYDKVESKYYYNTFVGDTGDRGHPFTKWKYKINTRE